VNLYKVLHAAIRSSPGDIVAERSSFPTDLYVARGVADERGMQLRLSEPGRSPAGIADAATGVVLVNHVDFKTGALADLEAVAAEAAGCGALLVADLSHSAGVVPTSLDAWAVDFAVGCTYKYLSGGPGAPAFLYAAAEHIDAVSPVIPGWMGHAEPFLMEPEYRPRTGVRRFMTGTPSILSMRALEGALGLIEEAGMGAIREKSVALTGTLMELIEEELPEASVITPHDPAQRGGQVSIRHPAGRTLSQALTAAGVRGDFRAPDVLRFGLSPLYTSFGDLGRAVATMKSVLEGMQPGPAGGGWDVPT
jgi:kynureninase